MPGPHFYETDLIQELRLRRWARRNYVPAEQRGAGWHPVVLDEMSCRDIEISDEHRRVALAYVPLAPTPPLPRSAVTFRPLPSGVHHIHEPHAEQPAPKIAAAPAKSRVFLC